MVIRKLNPGIAAILSLAFIALPVAADRDRDGYKKNRPVEKREQRQEHKYNKKDYEERGYKYDTRYRHNHFYPPRGHIERTLPKTYRVVPYRGVDYYFHSGIWYRRAGVSFSVVIPPVGIVVPVLPPYYTTIWVGATPYYYAGGVYYTWRPSVNGYVVVEEPDDDEVIQEPGVPDELYVYPKEGQSEEQQATDRYACYRWAADQTGFDPTQPGGDVPVEQHSDKRADYQRAMKACLEGRGYSVK